MIHYLQVYYTIAFIKIYKDYRELLSLIILVEERGKLFDEVEAEWLKKESKVLQRQEAPINDDEEEEDDSSDEIEECIVKV